MTKEEILDQYRDDSKFPNINEVVFKQRDVIEAMSEYASQCTAPLEARIRELEEGLREARKAFQWTWDNMGAPHTSDHFNVPANGIQLIDNLLSSSSSDGWVSVNERLPTESDADETGKVLVYRPTNEGQKALSKSLINWRMVKLCEKGTYWTTLPKNPNNI